MNKNKFKLPANASNYVHNYNGAWAITKDAAHQLLAISREINMHEHIQANEELDDTDRFPTYLDVIEMGGKMIATINIAGTMMRAVDSLSGGTATTIVRRELRSVAENDNIDGIMLIFDSPGGTVSGTHELAMDVRKAAAVKPVVAFVDDLCASAAYYVASQATRIVASSPSALIGSIGVIMTVVDTSKYYESMNVEVHIFKTGDLKDAGHEGVEMTREHEEYFQYLIDGSMKDFKDVVQSGRGLDDAGFEKVSRGGVFLANDALELGLIDEVVDIDNASMIFDGLIQTKKENTMNTLTELKAACPGADSEFLLKVLEAGVSVREAQAEWLTTLQAKVEIRDNEIAERDAAIEALQGNIAQLEMQLAEQASSFNAELAKVEAGVDPENAPPLSPEKHQTPKGFGSAVKIRN